MSRVWLRARSWLACAEVDVQSEEARVVFGHLEIVVEFGDRLVSLVASRDVLHRPIEGLEIAGDGLYERSENSFRGQRTRH